MTKKDFIAGRTRIISELLDNPDEQNNFHTTKCYKEFDKLYDEIVLSKEKTVLEKAIELITDKKVNPPRDGINNNEQIKVELIKAKKNNPHSYDNSYNELIKYDDGLDDAIEIIKELSNQ